jgi:hypothetical protein
MRLWLFALVLFTFVKGPELFKQFIDSKHRKVTQAVYKMYGNDPLEKIGIKFPNVVRAQIALETRWLSSIIYKENNNMFGMKESSRDWDCGSNRGHAKYPSCLYSLYDYRDWQKMRFEQAQRKGMKIPITEEEYIFFLQHLPGGGAYAEDPLYPSKLRYIMSL